MVGGGPDGDTRRKGCYYFESCSRLPVSKGMGIRADKMTRERRGVNECRGGQEYGEDTGVGLSGEGAHRQPGGRLADV